MNFIRQIERLQLVNRLIVQGKTGTPEELGDRLGLSKRQVFNIIEMLRDIGAPVSYNKIRKTYHYEEPCRLKIDFSLTLIEKNEEKKIYGGKKTQTAMFFHPGGLPWTHN